MFLFLTTVLGFKLHKRFFYVIFQQRNNAACWQGHSPILMKGIHQITRSTCTEQKVARKENCMKWFLHNFDIYPG